MYEDFILNKNIIALDIDDCILPSDQNYFGTTDDSLLLLEINCKRLRMICDKYNMQIFLTSAWVSILKLDGNDINFKKHRLFECEVKQLAIMKKYLTSPV